MKSVDFQLELKKILFWLSTSELCKSGETNEYFLMFNVGRI